MTLERVDVGRGKVIAGTDLRVACVDALADQQPVMDIWRELCTQCRHTYYDSPGWMENWLACVSSRTRPSLVLVLEGSTPKAAFIATRGRLLRGGLIPCRTINAFATGDYAMDRLSPIYNAFLMPDPTVRLQLRPLLEALPFPWDEVFLPGLAPDAFPGNVLVDPAVRWLVRDYDKPLYFVEMEQFVHDLDSYLACLSQNTRSQIRRSIRLYGNAGGPVGVTAAATVDEALDMARKLYRLVNIRKASQHIQSSIDAFFEAFHERLIRTRFAHGEIQLLHIHTDAATIGYLYNHVYQGMVYSYQSGFAYTSDNRLKPGLVSHVQAVLYNAGLGHRLYDFGPSAHRYKKSLATGEGVMPWVRVLRPSFKMGLYWSLKTLLERGRRLREHLLADVRHKACQSCDEH